MGQCRSKESTAPAVHFSTPSLIDDTAGSSTNEVMKSCSEVGEGGNRQQQHTKKSNSSQLDQQTSPTPSTCITKSQFLAQMSAPSGIETAQLTTVYRVPDSKYGSAEDVLRDRGLVLLDMFDEGGFAKVYRAGRRSPGGGGGRKTITGPPMACKVVDVGLDLSDSTKLADVKNELFVLEKVKHPHIVRMFEHFVVNEHLYIFMDYADLGNLYRFMYLHQGPLAEEEAVRPYAQIVSGVAYMHAQKIAHRDLKLSNILLKTLTASGGEEGGGGGGDSVVILIADFGLSRVVYRRRSGLVTCKSYCGTPNYMAPELKHRQQYNAFDIDMYALGVMLFVIVQGCYPFDHGDDERALAQAERLEIQWNREVPLSKAVRDLLVGLMQPSATRRMSMRQLLADKWLAKEMASLAAILPPLEMLPRKVAAASRRLSSPMDDLRLRTTKSSDGKRGNQANAKKALLNKSSKVVSTSNQEGKSTGQLRHRPKSSAAAIAAKSSGGLTKVSKPRSAAAAEKRSASFRSKQRVPSSSDQVSKATGAKSANNSKRVKSRKGSSTSSSSSNFSGRSNPRGGGQSGQQRHAKN